MTQMMTVLHLETGHIVATVSGAADGATVAELVGDDGLRRSYSADRHLVDVPTDLLTATRLPFNRDVVDGPQVFRVQDGQAVFVAGGLQTVAPTGAAGDAALVIAQTAAGPVAHRVVAGVGGAVPLAPPVPPEAQRSAVLIAVADGEIGAVP